MTRISLDLILPQFASRKHLSASLKLNPKLRRRRSVFVRFVNAGSCNDTDIEMAQLPTRVYNWEQFGFRLVTSPYEADLLVVSGPVVITMKKYLIETFRAMPESTYVVTLGDGFSPTGALNGAYGNAEIGLPEEMVKAWILHIPGDPPSAEQILEALLWLEVF
jgi:Ni,Fe-hydrogenase III small subunit